MEHIFYIERAAGWAREDVQNNMEYANFKQWGPEANKIYEKEYKKQQLIKLLTNENNTTNTED